MREYKWSIVSKAEKGGVIHAVNFHGGKKNKGGKGSDVSKE